MLDENVQSHLAILDDKHLTYTQQILTGEKSAEINLT